MIEAYSQPNKSQMLQELQSTWLIRLRKRLPLRRIVIAGGLGVATPIRRCGCFKQEDFPLPIAIRVGYCAGFVFGVKPLDPLSFIATPLLLSIVALVSIWAPALRATRVNPIAALRVE